MIQLLYKILLDIYHKRPIFIKIHGNSRKELFVNITSLNLNITKLFPVSFKSCKFWNSFLLYFKTVSEYNDIISIKCIFAAIPKRVIFLL